MSTRLGSFMGGFGAAVELFQRATSQGSCVEVVVVGATLVDGSLRIGLILNDQLRSGTPDIDDKLLSHDPRSMLTERQIFRRAASEGVIGSDLLAELEALYDDRNRVVHRYLISDITTDEVMQIAVRYERVIPLISACIGRLEQEQIHRGVGMTLNPDRVAPMEDDTRCDIAAKHGPWWSTFVSGRCVDKPLLAEPPISQTDPAHD